MQGSSTSIETTVSERCLEAAQRIYGLVSTRYLQPDGSVIGPDVGVRFNSRIWRFVKSYLRFLPWRDNHYYLQGQAYWLSANLKLYELTGDESYLSTAYTCGSEVLHRQTKEGYWEFPKTEWKGRIATVEGCFGALALIWCFDKTNEGAYLEGAEKWYDFLIEKTGFERYDGESLCINYFAGIPRGLVPNNATLALWFFAELMKASGDGKYTEYARPLVNFLSKVQLDSGELPYQLPGPSVRGRKHYLCYQYNAFQLMDLVYYLSISGDRTVEPVIEGLGRFLSGALSGQGFVKKDCETERPVVLYYTAAVAAALLEVSNIGLGDYVEESENAYGYLLSRQRRDGGFDYSYGDYGMLSDKRSYPKQLCMIIDHLLRPCLLEKGNGHQRAQD